MTVTNMRSAQTVTLIEAVACEGNGSPDDPVRLVTYYFTLEGRPVVTDDAGRRITAPLGIGTDGLFSEERHPTPETVWTPQPDGTLARSQP